MNDPRTETDVSCETGKFPCFSEKDSFLQKEVLIIRRTENLGLLALQKRENNTLIVEVCVITLKILELSQTLYVCNNVRRTMRLKGGGRGPKGHTMTSSLHQSNNKVGVSGISVRSDHWRPARGSIGSAVEHEATLLTAGSVALKSDMETDNYTKYRWIMRSNNLSASRRGTIFWILYVSVIQL